MASKWHMYDITSNIYIDICVCVVLYIKNRYALYIYIYILYYIIASISSCGEI